MGATLSEPVKDKEIEEGEDESYNYGIAAMQGWRTDMEDAHLAKLGLEGDPNAGVFAVFDGHCGHEVSRFAARYLAGQLEKTQGWGEGDIPRGLRDTYLRLDQALLHLETQPFLRGVALRADKAAERGMRSRPAQRWPEALAIADDHMANYPPPGLSQPNLDTHHLAEKVAMLVKSNVRLGTAAGCTAVTAVVRDGVVTCANAGDSRAVLCRGGTAVPLSYDHKPDNAEEQKRIEEAGGFVRRGRTMGNLSLSRALGDFEFKRNGTLPASKQMITAYPEISETELCEEDEFLILACDGIWEDMTSQQVVDFVRQRLDAGDTPAQAAAALCDHCLAPTLYSTPEDTPAMATQQLPGGVAASVPTGVAASEPAACLNQPSTDSEAAQQAFTASKDRPGMSHGASQGQYQSGLHAAAAKLEAAVSAKQVPDAAPRGVAAAAVGAAALQAAAAAQQKVEPAARGEADDGSMGGATGATEAAPGGVAFNDGQGEMASSSLDGECEELLASTPKGASESDCRSEPAADDPWEAFGQAMQMLSQNPNATEEDINSVVEQYYKLPPSPAEVAAHEHAIAGGKIYPPQPVGPDTPEGYGCDNMSVLVVRLKPPALRRQGNGSGATSAGAASPAASAAISCGPSSAPRQPNSWLGRRGGNEGHSLAQARSPAVVRQTPPPPFASARAVIVPATGGHGGVTMGGGHITSMPFYGGTATARYGLRPPSESSRRVAATAATGGFTEVAVPAALSPGRMAARQIATQALQSVRQGARLQAQHRRPVLPRQLPRVALQAACSTLRVCM
mmetsp:Transcript_9431/g.28369  ORF Transcript_9431/g.28369 Transcript_9431/m.28369 type:complete len:793 (-) Transcript_9431:419-2797(-)|eukprot:CAMPEP_0206141018 /NCGR_PEP_ID=MMETSP1473-20131121/11538_1 /ASSEMBLY_ACC=CAM_ASM_001109 /TAXON_ID=1461547 /ORGANISM="Stichococcus sp, Strain RCC1054" /LENGTH=792 /DNA_ID=CAMNT_0053535411 /DNA_START=209 /DNA_END=2587 /DNA_ORIENTATION=-